MLGGDLGDLLISDFKMASDSDSDSGPIIWRVDPDFPGADIRECSVNIRKCTSVSGVGHVEEEKSIVSGKEHYEEEESINNEDSGWADDILESKKSKLPKAAPKSKASKKRTKGVQNKEPVGGRCRKLGEQRKASGLAIKRMEVGKRKRQI